VSRVITVARATPPEPIEPSYDVVYGRYGMWRYLDKPVSFPRQHPGPYRAHVDRPDPRAFPIRVRRVVPPDWYDEDEDQD
jgi:hypothetical protein